MALNQIGPDNRDKRKSDVKNKDQNEPVKKYKRGLKYNIYIIYAFNSDALFTLDDKVGFSLS